MMKRPDMRDYFRAQIDHEVNGILSRSGFPRKPQGVVSVEGTVSDSVIDVHMSDGTTFSWEGGKYASRKVNGCYAPLMPKPIKE